ncbi:DUF2637 domain-containing protein [Nonomuraea sp. CA-143628]|uniref:DUF2637 domain-containing protein n=1 Tax=Nonomuraea sp. CA-143628 TaxID=3239997 RepID=UPI003D9311FD
MEPGISRRNIQRTTIGGVVLLAGIAAIVSFRHMHELCLRHGASPAWTGRLGLCRGYTSRVGRGRTVPRNVVTYCVGALL